MSKTVLLHIYLPELEHIMMALTILITGAFVFDIAEKDIKLNKK